MKRKIPVLILCHALFTALQVSLIAKISFIGKIAIVLAYKEYKFLRSFWKTYLLLFGAQLLVIGILSYTHKTQSRRTHYITCAVIFVLALLGLWYTYNDFVHTYSHRLLKERFHLGFYLFWIAMMMSCVFFLLLPRKGAGELINAPSDPMVPEKPASRFPAQNEPLVK